ncbi:hypothetical protein [Radiobacillus sp. PE A8.2]|uniref:hypothetical protein n=1 Tax=Radiobacillus sp. PE A8.2 TaxID=3380349 RepID=UPI00388CF453
MDYTIYSLFVIIASFISYKSAIYMMERTDTYYTNVFIASIINLQLVAFIVFGWFLYSWNIKETMFFDGLIWGIGLFVLSEAVMTAWFIYQKKKLEKIETTDYEIIESEKALHQ